MATVPSKQISSLRPSFQDVCMFHLHLFFSVLSIIVCYVSSEDCGQEELTNCARPLQILQSTSELSIAAKKEELEKLCP